eukprot:CAMPEP_0181231226 /NCGR_PEP_ID=MMETSP1096-20121128/34971_1 /TAXON_ID=156174 ORGANISM="Chrysochromulina ericina, Strain CCMP281" /NCGR_SAMPLE_ID=MMETSP1096 /ASSEMBLY_ACC=CAM_ASM_000453 /LENGTH=81 /DNA_ID=CAMNT_0023325209 /DNA_START=598 /DNA_END=843 /DNA_ORIENTATION=+
MVTHDSSLMWWTWTAHIEDRPPKHQKGRFMLPASHARDHHGEMARAVARVHKHGTSPGAQEEEPDSRRARWVSDPIKAQRT